MIRGESEDFVSLWTFLDEESLPQVDNQLHEIVGALATWSLGGTRVVNIPSAAVPGARRRRQRYQYTDFTSCCFVRQ